MNREEHIRMAQEVVDQVNEEPRGGAHELEKPNSCGEPSANV